MSAFGIIYTSSEFTPRAGPEILKTTNEKKFQGQLNIDLLKQNKKT